MRDVFAKPLHKQFKFKFVLLLAHFTAPQHALCRLTVWHHHTHQSRNLEQLFWCEHFLASVNNSHWCGFLAWEKVLVHWVQVQLLHWPSVCWQVVHYDEWHRSITVYRCESCRPMQLRCWLFSCEKRLFQTSSWRIVRAYERQTEIWCCSKVDQILSCGILDFKFCFGTQLVEPSKLGIAH